jgi:hypothetical protein
MAFLSPSGQVSGQQFDDDMYPSKSFPIPVILPPEAIKSRQTSTVKEPTNNKKPRKLLKLGHDHFLPHLL